MIKTSKAPPRFWSDSAWRMEHNGELRARFKDEWVAIVNKQVVAHGHDPAKLRREARKITKVKEDILVDYIEGDAHIYPHQGKS